LAVNPKGPDGQPLDDCAAAAQAGVGSYGGSVICKDGVKIACVFGDTFSSGNPSSAIKACVQCHEDMHVNKHSFNCKKSCGWSGTENLDPKDQCEAVGATIACLEKKVTNGDIDVSDPDYIELKNNLSWEAWACSPASLASDKNYCDQY